MRKSYVFTDLGEDFEHLGTMKKTTSVNVCTGPGCSYSFLHLTLQEYLTAFYIAIVNPCSFELVEWLEEGSTVVRFLAGMYRDNDYHSHPVYQELVQLLASEGLQLVHCAYECPSIMDSVKVDYSERDTINVRPVVGFDWYATGYCISHFDERWGLEINDYMGMEGVNLLVKGLRSSSIAEKRIRYLFLELEFFSQFVSPFGKFCELHHLIIFIRHGYFDHSDAVILQQLIAPGSGLRRLEYHSNNILSFYDSELHNIINTLVPLLFQPSSLQELILNLCVEEIVLYDELLPHENTNLKKLTILRYLLHPLAALIMNITSLTYLKISFFLRDSDLPVLTNIVQLHHTLEVLDIGEIDYNSDENETNLLQLIEAAGNSQLKKLRLDKPDYDKLPPHIHEQYKHLLEPW